MKGQLVFYDWGAGIAQARAYREMAYLYYQDKSKGSFDVSDKCIVSGLWPVCVAWAFSCEISLKLLYEAEKGNAATGHGIKGLFDALSIGTQDELIALADEYCIDCCWETFGKTCFFEYLEKTDQTFSNERYLFEIKPGTSHGVSPMLLEAFSYALLEHLSRFRLSPRAL